MSSDKTNSSICQSHGWRRFHWHVACMLGFVGWRKAFYKTNKTVANTINWMCQYPKSRHFVGHLSCILVSSLHISIGPIAMLSWAMWTSGRAIWLMKFTGRKDVQEIHVKPQPGIFVIQELITYVDVLKEYTNNFPFHPLIETNFCISSESLPSAPELNLKIGVRCFTS